MRISNRAFISIVLSLLILIGFSYFFQQEQSDNVRIIGKWQDDESSSMLEFLEEGTFKATYPEQIGPGERTESVTILKDNGETESMTIKTNWEGVHADMIVTHSLNGIYKFTNHSNVQAYISPEIIPLKVKDSSLAIFFEGSVKDNQLIIKGKSRSIKDGVYKRIK